MDKINLTKDGSCSLLIGQLPSKLIQWGDENYDDINSYREKDYEDGVIVIDKETGQYAPKKIFRRYQSYGKTPEFKGYTSKSPIFSGNKSHMFSGTSKSYMFSEGGNKVERILPEVFNPFKDYVEDSTNLKFNNQLVNWYDTGDEYIEMHSDCTSSMVVGHTIGIININAPDSTTNREFLVRAKEPNDNNIISELSISLSPGIIIFFQGDTQKHFRHGVDRASGDIESKRISLTLRQMK